MRLDELTGLPVASQNDRVRLSPVLQSRQIHKILDLADVIPNKKDPKYITVKWKPSARSILKQSGIYIWMHPDFGIFYVGIASRDNLSQRWGSHLIKLLGRPPSYWPDGFYPTQWRAFAEKFLAQGFGKMDVNAVGKDLEKVRVAFYPITMPENLSPEEYKNGLEDLEDRIVQRWNPRAQGKFKADKPTISRNI